MKILKKEDLNNIVFIDIETVQLVENLEKNTDLYSSWEYKMKYSKDAVEAGEKSYEEMFNAQAQLYPEFAKVVTIVIGKIKDNVLKLKTFSGYDEKQLLTDFNNVVNNMVANNKNTKLCGHAINMFDIPFLNTRCLINQIDPTSLIDVAHLKPWDLTSIDTMVLWKGSSIRSASLINIAVALGLPSPKDDMFGYESSKVYYTQENGLERITEYCKKDVLTVANIVRKCRFEEIVTCEEVQFKQETVGLLQRVYNTKTLTKEDGLKVTKVLETLTEEEKIIANELLDICIK